LPPRSSPLLGWYTPVSNFANSVASWAKRTTQEIDSGVNQAITDFCVTVIDATPVDADADDNIVARDNWSLEDKGSDGEMVTGLDSGGTVSKANVAAKLGTYRASKHPGSLVFMNNARGKSAYNGADQYYANVLEYGLFPWHSSRRTINGFSTQAPSGMVRMNLIEFHFSLRDYFGTSIKGFSREL